MKIGKHLYHITGRLSLRNTLTIGALALWLALGGGAGALAWDDPPNRSTRPAAVLERNVQSDTGLLLSLAAGAAKSADTAKPLALDKNLLTRAERRQEAMLSLMEQAPAVALKYAMSAEQRQSLPPDIRAHVEEWVTVEGTLEVLGSVSEDGRLGIERYLDLGDSRLRLFVDDLPGRYVTGTPVIVDGLRLADRLAADPSDVTALAPTDPSPNSPTRRTDGVRRARALVININFEENPSEPWTVERSREVFVDQITPWFAEVSYNQFDFQPEVAGWYTIQASPSNCPTGQFRDQAEAAATADGFNPPDYDHVVIVFPRVPACRWSGLAQIRGRYSWLNNAMNRSTAVHELGHNLGLYHSHSRRCSDGPLSGDCSTSEYGDRFDVMGRGNSIPYHGAFKASLEWIPEGDVISITQADRSRMVTINSVERTSGPRVVRIERPGRQDFFTVETREPIGLSAPLGNYPALLNGVPVYLGSPTRGMADQSVIVIDYEGGDPANAPLLVGDILYDPESTLSIAPLAVGNGQATIFVNYLP